MEGQALREGGRSGGHSGRFPQDFENKEQTQHTDTPPAGLTGPGTGDTCPAVRPAGWRWGWPAAAHRGGKPGPARGTHSEPASSTWRRAGLGGQAAREDLRAAILPLTQGGAQPPDNAGPSGIRTTGRGLLPATFGSAASLARGRGANTSDTKPCVPMASFGLFPLLFIYSRN